MQRALRLIYPSECLLCRDLTESDFALCGACWRETPFTAGLVCDQCGIPLMGEDEGNPVHCDDCMTIARPWDRGRAAMSYRDNGRKIVLALKHGDRSDLARPAAKWMARVATPLMDDTSLLVPVPLHWSRLLARRYNQSAMLTQALSKETGVPVGVDSLVRIRRTKTLGGQSRDQRFATLDGAIRPHPKRGVRMSGKTVVLVDDVMTSGATLAACADAARSAGAAKVHVLILARAGKDA